jgi:hypothetical protein
MIRPLGIVGLMLSLAAFPAHAKTLRIVACVPDAPGTMKAAAPILARFFRALETAMGWPEGRVDGLFTRSKARCVKELRRSSTALAILSPELYASLQRRFKMRPLALTEVSQATTTRYHLVTKKGEAGLEKLAGARIITNHGADAQFLSRVVLGGKLGPSVSVRRTTRPLEALRAVRRGDEAATLLDDTEIEKMKVLPFADEMQVIYSSEPIPNPIVVAVDERAGAGVADEIAGKLGTLCRGEVKAVCDTLRLSGFAAPDKAILDAVLEKYGK